MSLNFKLQMILLVQEGIVESVYRKRLVKFDQCRALKLRCLETIFVSFYLFWLHEPDL